MGQMQKHPVAVAFGRALREAREKAGVSQEELALACDIDRTYVSLLERGLRQPTLATLLGVSSQLNVDAEELVSATRANLRMSSRRQN